MAVSEQVRTQELIPSTLVRRPQWQRPSLSGWRLALVWGALFMGVLILAIPTYLLIRVIGAGQATIDTLLQARTLEILGNTVLLAAAVTFSTTIIAVPIAFLTTHTDLPGRKIWAGLAALPLVIPSYVAAYLYVSVLSPKGLVQQMLYPLFGIERLPNIYGFAGAFFVLTLISYPFTLLTVRAALKRMDPALLEAARSLGLSPKAAFFRVTLPNLRPSILAGGLLVALYTLRDFGAVNMLQYPTFTRIIYNRYLGFQLDAAAGMALVLIALTAVILIMEQRSRGKARYARTSIGAARKMPVIKLGRWRWPALGFVSSVVFLSLVMPAATLIYWFWRGWQQDFLVRDLSGAQQNIQSLATLLVPAWNSLSASVAAGFLAVAMALPIAILSVRHPGKLSHFFERLTYATFALPGVVVALAYVFIGNKVMPALYQTLPMLLAAYVILFIPQAVGAIRSQLLQLSPHVEEAGRSLGKRPFTVMVQITLPLVKAGLVSGGALVFLTAMKELPATLILSPIGFDTLAASVWTNINEAFFARAAAPTLLLILLSSVPLAWLTLRDRL